MKQLFDDNNQTEAEHHLRIIVQVLTSKACSEDGLEDATMLLLNLSKCSNKTRFIIHHLLLDGACSVSQMVLRHINDLMLELKQLKVKCDNAVTTIVPSIPTVAEKLLEVVPIDADEDLLLLTPPSTTTAAAAANVETAAGGSGGSAGLRRPNRGVLQDRFTKESVVITAPNKVKTSCDLQLPSMAPLVSKTSSQAFFLRILKVITQIRDSVYQTMKTEMASTTKTVEPNELELSPLSETLKLDELWDTLSECLKELEETSDHHAVLVLQPTVEAFFLVHASNQNKSCAALKAAEEAKKEEEAAAAAKAAADAEALAAQETVTPSEQNPTSDVQSASSVPETSSSSPEEANAMESTPTEPTSSETPAAESGE